MESGLFRAPMYIAYNIYPLKYILKLLFKNNLRFLLTSLHIYDIIYIKIIYKGCLKRLEARMLLTNMIERKKLEQVSELITVNQFKSTMEGLLQLHRIGLLEHDDALILMSAYVRLVKEV